MTARALLRRYEIGEPLPDLGVDPVGADELASAIHECEREAVMNGQAVVSLQRPWTEYAELPEVAREGRRMQAAFLKSRAFFIPVTEVRA